MNKHTPAPWIYNGTLIETPNGTPLFYAGQSDDERDANSLLIAAAPILLEALELCSKSLATYGSHPIIEKIANNAINKATKP